MTQRKYTKKTNSTQIDYLLNIFKTKYPSITFDKSAILAETQKPTYVENNKNINKNVYTEIIYSNKKYYISNKTNIILNSDLIFAGYILNSKMYIYN